jgi:hypothetical protein
MEVGRERSGLLNQGLIKWQHLSGVKTDGCDRPSLASIDSRKTPHAKGALCDHHLVSYSRQANRFHIEPKLA